MPMRPMITLIILITALGSPSELVPLQPAASLTESATLLEHMSSANTGSVLKNPKPMNAQVIRPIILVNFVMVGDLL